MKIIYCTVRFLVYSLCLSLCTVPLSFSLSPWYNMPRLLLLLLLRSQIYLRLECGRGIFLPLLFNICRFLRKCWKFSNKIHVFRLQFIIYCLLFQELESTCESAWRVDHRYCSLLYIDSAKSAGVLWYEMLIKEYRILLPLTVEEYRIAQLYMIQVSFQAFKCE